MLIPQGQKAAESKSRSTILHFIQPVIYLFICFPLPSLHNLLDLNAAPPLRPSPGDAQPPGAPAATGPSNSLLLKSLQTRAKPGGNFGADFRCGSGRGCPLWAGGIRAELPAPGLNPFLSAAEPPAQPPLPLINGNLGKAALPALGGQSSRTAGSRRIPQPGAAEMLLPCPPPLWSSQHRVPGPENAALAGEDKGQGHCRPCGRLEAVSCPPRMSTARPPLFSSVKKGFPAARKETLGTVPCAAAAGAKPSPAPGTADARGSGVRAACGSGRAQPLGRVPAPRAGPGALCTRCWGQLDRAGHGAGPQVGTGPAPELAGRDRKCHVPAAPFSRRRTGEDEGWPWGWVRG